MTVRIQIERVILEGITLGPGERGQLRDALSAALSELLAEKDLDWSKAASGRVLTAPSLTLGMHADAPVLARGIAGSLRQGLFTDGKTNESARGQDPRGGRS